MNLLFKEAYIILLLSACFISGCKTNDGDNNEATVELNDTINKALIDTTVILINKLSKEKGSHIKTPFPLYSPDDTIRHWKLANNLEQISVAITTSDTIVWPTFFLENNKLILVRYRLWAKTFVQEELIYLKDGNVIYCSERNMVLEGGAMPGMLKRKKFTPCTKTSEQLKKAAFKYWEQVKQLL